MKATLTVIEGPQTGKVYSFDGHDTFIAGRAKTAQFRVVEDEYFSRNHFLIEVNPPFCRLLDLDSRSGTFVNGIRVKKVEIKEGDKITGGKTTFVFGLQSSSDSGDAHSEPTILQPLQSEVDGDGADSETPVIPAAVTPRLEISTALPQFPGYRTIRLIGKGGMGTVYEADSLADRSRVAIKVITPNTGTSQTDIGRFLREASILRELVHPHIVGYRDMNQYEGELFIVMDYIDGVTVNALLNEDAACFPARRAVEVTCQLLSALDYAHQRGYVHRDVKPANLLLTTRGGIDHVALADFGLARTYQSSRLSGLTMTGMMGGTTPFMPPEQIQNFKGVAPPADQYSAAATLYFLLTNKQIYDFPRKPTQQLLMVLQEDPVRIEKRRADLPAKLATAIHKALSRLPHDRFPDAMAFQRALRAAII